MGVNRFKIYVFGGREDRYQRVRYQRTLFKLGVYTVVCLTVLKSRLGLHAVELLTFSLSACWGGELIATSDCFLSALMISTIPRLGTEEAGIKNAFFLSW